MPLMKYSPHCRQPVFIDWGKFVAVYGCEPYWSPRKPITVSHVSFVGTIGPYPATMASVV